MTAFEPAATAKLAVGAGAAVNGVTFPAATGITALAAAALTIEDLGIPAAATFTIPANKTVSVAAGRTLTVKDGGAIVLTGNASAGTPVPAPAAGAAAADGGGGKLVLEGAIGTSLGTSGVIVINGAKTAADLTATGPTDNSSLACVFAGDADDTASPVLIPAPPQTSRVPRRGRIRVAPPERETSRSALHALRNGRQQYARLSANTSRAFAVILISLSTDRLSVKRPAPGHNSAYTCFIRG